MGQRLRARSIFVLHIAPHIIALCNCLGRLQHRHVNVGLIRHEPRVGRDAHLFGLNHRNALDTATYGHVHTVHHNLFRSRRNCHHSRCTLTVQRHARDTHRQACAHRSLACNVATGMALLQSRAKDHILHASGINPCARNGVFNRVTRQFLRRRVVESTAIGFANRRACGGYDNCIAHINLP